MTYGRREKIHITDLPLANHKNVLSVSVAYNQRRKRIELQIIPLFRTPGSTLVMMSLFGGPRCAYEYLADCGRYSEKKLEEYALAIDAVVKGASAADKAGLKETYDAALKTVLDANGYVLADDEHPVFAPEVFEVGQRVVFTKQNVNGWVVGLTEYHGLPAYRIISDDNDDELREFACAVPDSEYHPFEKASGQAISEYVARLIETYDKQCAERKEAREREEAAKAAAALEASAAVRQEFPWAKQDGSDHARASWNLKTQLQMKYPGVEFKVTSSSYAGGSSLDVRWTDGPTETQVREISNRYQACHFDGMNDMETYVETDREFRRWMGDVSYVHESRRHSDEAIKAVHQAVQEAYGTSDLAYGHYNLPQTILYRSEIYGEFADLDKTRGEWVAVFAKPERPAVAPPPASGEGVTVRENKEKGGVEVKFSEKPDSFTIESLKRHRFRWSKFQKLWYAKATTETIRFAYALAGISEDTRRLAA